MAATDIEMLIQWNERVLLSHDFFRNILKMRFIDQYDHTYTREGGDGGGSVWVLLQTTQWVNLPASQCRFVKDIAEARRLIICLTRRLMKNVCQGSQNSFAILHEKEK